MKPTAEQTSRAKELLAQIRIAKEFGEIGAAISEANLTPRQKSILRGRVKRREKQLEWCDALGIDERTVTRQA